MLIDGKGYPDAYKKLYEKLKELVISGLNGAECPDIFLGKDYDSILKSKTSCAKRDCEKCFKNAFEEWEGEILKND